MNPIQPLFDQIASSSLRLYIERLSLVLSQEDPKISNMMELPVLLGSAYETYFQCYHGLI